MRKFFERTILFAMVGALALAALPATAQETTGSLKGMVADDVGTPIAGSIIEAVGPLGTLSTTSDAQGNYRFPRLPAGNYTVTARFTGFIDAATDVNVNLGDAKSINFSMQKTFSEEITVYSDTVSIDFTDSATTTSIREWEIDYLPRGRDFTDVVMFASGATYDNQGGGIMIDGASGLENRYIIDGIDTTDPQDGSSAVPMRAEMMEEVQVKSAGYAAEFGGAMGGVINAVTKSGSNQFHGSVFTDYENMDWNGSARPVVEYNLDDAGASLNTYDKDDETRWDPGFSLGGPILRDKWWFFASYQPGIRTRERTVDWVNGDPTDTYKSDFQVDYATLNTTVNISSSLLLKVGASVSPYTTEGLLQFFIRERGEVIRLVAPGSGLGGYRVIRPQHLKGGQPALTLCLISDRHRKLILARRKTGQGEVSGEGHPTRSDFQLADGSPIYDPVSRDDRSVDTDLCCLAIQPIQLEIVVEVGLSRHDRHAGRRCDPETPVGH